MGLQIRAEYLDVEILDLVLLGRYTLLIECSSMLCGLREVTSCKDAAQSAQRIGDT